MMAALILDGRRTRVDHSASLLEAMRAAGIAVPSLCHHPALEPWGGCRLCLVEVGKESWGDSTRLVASCMYPVEDGLIVVSRSEAVVAARKVVLDLLLARCPETPLVQRLAREYGIASTSYETKAPPTDCVLCGLCTRACDRVGVFAIASANRGAGREIAPPFLQPPPDCIGCLACANICPTAHIRVEQTASTRKIWGRTFEMARCSVCGSPVMTREQADFERRAHGIPAEDLGLCDGCKRRRLEQTMVRLMAGAAGQ